MKATILFLVSLLVIGMAWGCEKSVVTGNVADHIEGMTIRFYCDGEYWDEKDIISKYGNYQRTSSYCPEKLVGKLYIDENLIDEKEATRDDLCDFELDFQGVAAVPEFGTLGLVMSLLGVIVVRKRFK